MQANLEARTNDLENTLEIIVEVTDMMKNKLEKIDKSVNVLF